MVPNHVVPFGSSQAGLYLDQSYNENNLPPGGACYRVTPVTAVGDARAVEIGITTPGGTLTSFGARINALGSQFEGTIVELSNTLYGTYTGTTSAEWTVTFGTLSLSNSIATNSQTISVAGNTRVFWWIPDNIVSAVNATVSLVVTGTGCGGFDTVIVPILRRILTGSITGLRNTYVGGPIQSLRGFALASGVFGTPTFEWAASAGTIAARTDTSRADWTPPTSGGAQTVTITLTIRIGTATATIRRNVAVEALQELEVPTVTPTPFSSGSITLTLTEIDSNATGWQYRTASTETGLRTANPSAIIQGTTGTNRSVNFAGTLNVATWFQVRARSTRAGFANASRWTAPRSVTPTPTGGTVTTPLGDLTAIATPKDGAITLTRGPLPSNATAWQYRSTTTFAQIDQVLGSADQTNPTADISGTNGTTIWYQVRAIATGTAARTYSPGPWSPIQSAVPNIIATPLSALTATATPGDAQITITRGNLPGNADRWQYRTAASRNTLPSAMQSSDQTASSATITGTNGTAIWWQVRATSTNTTRYTPGPWSPPQSTTPQLPATPAIPLGPLTATHAVDSGRLIIRRGDFPPNADRWQYRSALTSNRVSQATPSDDLLGITAFIPGQVGQPIFYQVRATSSTPTVYSPGPWSAIASGTPRLRPALGALTGFALARNNHILILRGPLPPNATGWQYRTASTQAGLDFVLPVTRSDNVPTASVFGPNGTQIYWQVRAIAAGVSFNPGPWSPIRVETPAIPNMLGALTARPLSIFGFIEIYRNALPPGANRWQYRAASTQAGLITALISPNINASTARIAGTLGTPVWWQVRATAASGPYLPGPWSDAVMSMTAPPTPLGRLSVTGRNVGGNLELTRGGLPPNANQWEFRFAVTEAGLETADITISTGNVNTIRVTPGTATLWYQARADSRFAAYTQGPWSDPQSIDFN